MTISLSRRLPNGRSRRGEHEGRRTSGGLRPGVLAESQGFEPWVRFKAAHTISSRAPSTTRTALREGPSARDDAATCALERKREYTHARERGQSRGPARRWLCVSCGHGHRRNPHYRASLDRGGMSRRRSAAVAARLERAVRCVGHAHRRARQDRRRSSGRARRTSQCWQARTSGNSSSNCPRDHRRPPPITTVRASCPTG